MTISKQLILAKDRQRKVTSGYLNKAIRGMAEAIAVLRYEVGETEKVIPITAIYAVYYRRINNRLDLDPMTIRNKETLMAHGAVNLLYEEVMKEWNRIINTHGTETVYKRLLGWGTPYQSPAPKLFKHSDWSPDDSQS